MHCSFAIALALAATVWAEATAAVESTFGHIATDVDNTYEYTTVDARAAFEDISKSDAVDDNPIKFEGSRRRRVEGVGVSEVGDFHFSHIYPYIVALYAADGTYKCLGTILTSSLIMTARRCAKSNSVTQIRAHSRDKDGGGEMYVVEESIFYVDSSEHDIALLHLKTKISNASFVPLAEPDKIVYPTATVIALGWGRTRNDASPRYLREVNLVVASVDKCEELYGQNNNWLCTESRSSSVCDGDFGGPLLYKSRQVGIISHGKGEKCGSGIPTANVRVKRYLDWINSYIGLYSDTYEPGEFLLT